MGKSCTGNNSISKCFLKINKNETIQWFTVAGIFLPVNFMMILFPMILEIFSLIFASILVFSIRKKILINCNILLGLSLVSIFYAIVIFFNGYSYSKYIRETIFLFLFLSLYYILFEYNKNQIASLFQKYLRLAHVTALFAIFQFLIYFVFGVNIFSLFSRQTSEVIPYCIRVTAFEMEPSVLSTILLPAFVYLLFNYKHYKRNFWTIALTIFLTFSTVAYVIGISVVAFYFLSKFNVLIKFAILLLMLFIYVGGDFIITNEVGGNAFKDISIKIEQTYEGFKDLDPQALEMLNLSSYATLMNFYVAINAPSRITGTGIGTHSQSYEKIYQSDYENYGLNKNDAYSLATRIFSEFGFIGIGLIMVFILYNFNSGNILNISAFFIILTFFLRGGHYFINGTVFFFFLYYYTNKNHINFGK